MATLILDRTFNILTFNFNGVNVSFGISKKIKDISVQYFDDTGYIELMTNVGLEGIDIIYGTETLSDVDIKKLKAFFSVKNNKIEVRYT